MFSLPPRSWDRKHASTHSFWKCGFWKRFLIVLLVRQLLYRLSRLSSPTHWFWSVCLPLTSGSWSQRSRCPFVALRTAWVTYLFALPSSLCSNPCMASSKVSKLLCPFKEQLFCSLVRKLLWILGLQQAVHLPGLFSPSFLSSLKSFFILFNYLPDSGFSAR